MTAVLIFAAALGLGWAACLVSRRREWNQVAQWWDEDREDWHAWIERHLRRPKPKTRPVLFDGAMYPEDWGTP